MNNNIWAGSVLAAPQASPTSIEFSIQNPSLSRKGEDAFSHLLKQQVGAPQAQRASRPEPQSHSQARSPARKADSRPSGGNSLPERKVSADRTSPAPQPTGKTPVERSAAVNKSQAVDRPQQSAVDEEVAEQAANAPVSAELAAAPLPEAEEPLENADPSATAEVLLAALHVPVTPLPVPAPAGELAGTGPVAGDDILVAQTVSAVADEVSASVEGALENGELGPEPDAAEQNAEKNAENARQLAANGTEPTGLLKAQLAALVQHFKGNAGTTEERADGKDVDVGQEIKAPAFGRALEQLGQVRTESAKPVSTGIQTPLGQREWAGELSQRLMMMVSSKLKTAEIHLNPKELGPVEVRIRMHEDKAHVVFTSQVAQTREALEQAVPRLREMFEQNGVGLGNVDVQDHGTQHSQQHEQTEDGRRGPALANADGETVSEAAPVRIVGLVDYYA